jgi:hypothetical protein
MSTPRIDEFFIDADYGRIKFLGYKNGQFLFNTYDKPVDRWREREGMLELHPAYFESKLKMGTIKPSLAPE